MKLNRRHFIGTTAAATASLSAPMVLADGHAKPRVVVVGGGAGGATAARYIAKDSKGAIDVTLIEPTRMYYTCFFSNLYLGGFKDIEDIGHSYGSLAAGGVNVVHDWAVGVDRDAKTVSLAGGGSVPYDKLILSPGIDFVDGAVEGWDLSAQNAMPHAYKAGSQSELLKAQLMAMPEGGIFAMVAPPNPYRCPPGPYERVSMVAHFLKNNNPTAKIIVADPKPKFSKMALFQEGWANHYEGMIDWIGEDFGGGNVSVDPNAMTVTIDGEETKVDVCNVIPAMKAGRIAEIAGVTDGNWAPVNAVDMSTKADADIYVLGDASQQGDMPKSGFSANSQAKVCANAVRGALTGSKVFPARFSNTCWSLIDTNDGVKVGASYEATDEKIAKVDGFISQTGESADLRKATYEESEGWYAGITADMFG
ncbi:FAD-dependent oxidoreductase [Sulfitobacter mediterraneus]|jgi:sulfide dehydrogenase [flavocytochrome c] flavoprotein chain|uniref:NAD(P)/FAD-dependent oxidoreductase n=1 Tax=Sulfitobacter mediterraneus TaxID=83219 RepID=UPI00193398EF|nr:NAD(P)/FAD-dependent oxidoreductase [Sulfitobacter mediterraneus]MBM1634455.1 FAD-dependent oxidoreductase [Sulfitobacter mediterraneus]MBM1642272.1 FAD-dependent oxidoreductase [Sulfitobacter mediterraneus]MBM1646321.1 FAD-dependent oxidoreductase [Sulfitobacter mediterraneus]MBM1650367.1 FAD-dependent oxidoreductase [Sulfitobacter mediterraneus]MBM1654389.1 FAD-dependent oxidoreductase [Sulfitobacter mediterraneus]